MTGLIFMALAVISFNAKALDVLNHNPFERPDMKANLLQSNANQANAMKLRGTVIDGQDSLVNISGKFYRLNQEVADYRVVAITSTSVTLRRGSSETILTLNDNE